MDPLKDSAKQRLSVLGRNFYDESKEFFQDVTGDVRGFIDDLKLKGQQTGLEPVGDGLGRVVFRLPDDFVKPRTEGDYVVKIAIFSIEEGKGGLDQNEQEYTIWTDHPSVREDLVPVTVTDDSFYWLVMPYAEPVERSQRDLISEISLEGHDVRPENLGWYQDEVRLLDYGWKIEV
jgi:hypothetical protein